MGQLAEGLIREPARPRGPERPVEQTAVLPEQAGQQEAL